MFSQSPFRIVLNEINTRAQNAHEKGKMFERLTKVFLQNDALWKGRFQDVWLWREWPQNGNISDSGIDIVAKNIDDDGYTAIQCKYYPSGSSIDHDAVSAFITTSGRYTPGGPRFTKRIFVSVDANWTAQAKNSLNQDPPVKRLGISDFENSSIDWSEYNPGRRRQRIIQIEKKTPRAHQQDAISAVLEGFQQHNRGKLIMACGTGKTFTALRIAEQQTEPGDIVLFLAPSITLVSQSIRDWSNDASVPMKVHAVCSDATVGKHADSDSGDINVYDIAAPATTNASQLLYNIQNNHSPSHRTVIFSTYQSIDVISHAQQMGMGELALVVCDEAHRTAGATQEGEQESVFIAAHNEERINARRRLYMTATPRIFTQNSKSKAKDARQLVASMDDESIYGPEFYRYDFARAVEDGNLCDYRVLVFGIDERTIARGFQSALAFSNRSLNDVGCIIASLNAMAKKKSPYEDFAQDPDPMQSVVAFAGIIRESEAFAASFNDIAATFDSNEYAADHIDGRADASERANKLNWLRENQEGCRVLSNARCLTEGVDVPALDAVLFLKPRRSQIDVVQAVGRAMRTAPGKKFGYIIIPITVPAEESYEKVILDSSYNPTFQVLQALKSHDEDFYDTINQRDLNDNEKINVVIFGDSQQPDADADPDSPQAAEPGAKSDNIQLALDLTDKAREVIFTRIVDSLTDKHYYKKWADETAAISRRYEDRVRALLTSNRGGVRAEFAIFHESLKQAVNDGITEDMAVSLLAQHMVTRPVFDALFAEYDFAKRNPVSQAMERMATSLSVDHGTDGELQELDNFYRSIQRRVKYVNTPEKRQRIIADLYQDYFKAAFPRDADALGIVYTPTEAVDFIIHSVQDILKESFDASISDSAVDVLDPFTGTGTFIARLIENNNIDPSDLIRKYTSELHATEINLLAYYIASVNIETAFQKTAVSSEYTPFPCIVFGDSFERQERWNNRQFDQDAFAVNNDRMTRQNAKDIRVIIGNPPWSIGQASQNDDNQNRKYPILIDRISHTYAAESTAQIRMALYDKYFQAIRMASDRVEESDKGGIVAFITNGGFIDGNAAAGVRKCLLKEFHEIYCLNLRGDQRTSGEKSRQEGGKLFGTGSRASVAILMLVKKPGKVNGQGNLHYYDIGDYLTREQKLDYLSKNRKSTVAWRQITPDKHGDWINQRETGFHELVPLYGEKDAIFLLDSSGIITSRDAWIYNFSRTALEKTTKNMVDFFNANIPTTNPNWATTDFKRTDITDQMARRGTRLNHSPTKIIASMYRAFSKQHTYFDPKVIHRVYKQAKIYPDTEHKNVGIAISEKDKNNPIACLMTDVLPNRSIVGYTKYHSIPTPAPCIRNKNESQTSTQPLSTHSMTS